MTDRDAILAAILSEPREDTPRLVYADWCDENYQPDYAAFVRCQVELAKPPLCDWKKANVRSCREFFDGGGVEAWCGSCQQRNALQEREGKLWTPSWFLVPPITFVNHPDGGATYARDGPTLSATVSRGFVSSLTLPLIAFTAEMARAVFSAQPIENVTLSDREPNDYGSPEDGCKFGWLSIHEPRGHPAGLPRDLLLLLPPGEGRWSNRYPTRAAAISALSSSCIAWGRRLAGLS